jgi:hypothetical protein
MLRGIRSLTRRFLPMPYHWPADTVFQELTLEVEQRTCWQCEHPLTICCHRQRRFFTADGPVQLLSKLCHCSNATCPGRATTLSPEAETALVMPYWVLAWEVFGWLGHRRFARHWSVPQIRDELADRFAIPLSVDAIERYVGRYQRMVAARHQDPAEVAAAYRRTKGLILAIDGIQPEKGHETLYVVREVGCKRVWFAEALLSSNAAEVQRLLARAREWVERLGLPVRCWLSDKQDAFVTAALSANGTLSSGPLEQPFGQFAESLLAWLAGQSRFDFLTQHLTL